MATPTGWHVGGLHRWVRDSDGLPHLASISLIGDSAWMALVGLSGARQIHLGDFTNALSAQHAVNEFIATHGVDCAGCDRCDRCDENTKIMTELTR